MQETRKGMLLVLSGPSGTGKGTLGARLLEEDKSFFFSVSVTTRKPRDYEIPDVHYHFIDDAAYDRLLAEDAFLEHATVHAHRYGTLKSEVYAHIDKGENVLLDIDTQGAIKVMENAPDCVTVFVLPPSYEVLYQRLHTRNTEDEEEIAKRIRNARGEIRELGRYRYALINDTFDEAYATLRHIVEAEKQNTRRFFYEVPEKL